MKIFDDMKDKIDEEYTPKEWIILAGMICTAIVCGLACLMFIFHSFVNILYLIPMAVCAFIISLCVATFLYVES